MSSVVLYCATVTVLQFFCTLYLHYLRGSLESPSKIRLDVSCERTVRQCIGFMFSIFIYLYMSITRMLAIPTLGFICSNIVFLCKVFIYKNAKLEQLNRKCKSC